MPVTKRLRYEILRRDNHACRYCGATAPEVALTVDHVIPQALGGSDEPSNLVAACTSCNAGKSASAPDAPLVDDITSDAIRWANAMRRAAAIQRAAQQERNEYISAVIHHWDCFRWGDENDLYVPTDSNWEISLGRFYDADLSLDETLAAVTAAMGVSHVQHDNRWRYFCGICWRMLDERREIARSLIDAEELTTDGS